MSSDVPLTKRDLERIAEAYLAGRFPVVEFRGRLVSAWNRLGRAALTAEERPAWGEIFLVLDDLVRHGQASDGSHPALFDEPFLDEALGRVLGLRQGAPTQRARRARSIQQAISEVLLTEWDPIGVSDVPEAADEYDRYVGGVYRLIVSGATRESLAQHLGEIESKDMGLFGSSAQDLLHAADELLSIDLSL